MYADRTGSVTDNQIGIFVPLSPNVGDLVQRYIPKFRNESGWSRAAVLAETYNISETGQGRTKVAIDN